MESKHHILMPEEYHNTLDNFGTHIDEKFILEEQDINKDYKNLVDKISDTRSYTNNRLLGHISLNRLFVNELLFFLREVKFSEQEFSTSEPISTIKYYHPGFQNNNLLTHSMISRTMYLLII